MKAQRPYLFRAIYDWLLDNHWTPYLLVDATHPEVEVPLSFVQNGKIVLNLSPEAIHDYYINENTIGFSARFSGRSQKIIVPFSASIALYAKENGMGMMFPPEMIDSSKVFIPEKGQADMPAAIAHRQQGVQLKEVDDKKNPVSAKEKKMKKNLSGLKIVK